MKPKIKIIEEQTQQNPFTFGLVWRILVSDHTGIIDPERCYVLALAVDTKRWGKRGFRHKKRHQAIRMACNFYRYKIQE